MVEAFRQSKEVERMIRNDTIMLFIEHYILESSDFGAFNHSTRVFDRRLVRCAIRPMQLQPQLQVAGRSGEKRREPKRAIESFCSSLKRSLFLFFFFFFFINKLFT